MRSMWKGAISFGLVMIPVKLYAATEQKDITFRQVHRADGGRIRFRRVCSVCGEEVAYEDVAKGYELPSGEMVILTDEDMAELPLPTTRNIEVLNFAPAEQLDPILYNRSYYVEPETSGTRAYVLLREALEQSGKLAIAQVALRQRESLATLRARDGVLVLETLLWPDEVRAASFGFLDEDIEVRSQELTMASSLIDSMTVDFEPGEYRDGYREALAELVHAKADGRDVVAPQEPGETAEEPTSLADALHASLAAAMGGQRAGGRARPGSGRKPAASGSRSGNAAAGSASGRGAKSTAAASSARTAKTAASKTAASKTAASKTTGPSRTAAVAAKDAEPDSGKPAPARKTTASSGSRRAKRKAS